MAESYVQVAVDAAGKKVHTRQRVVGANTIEDQFVILASSRTRTGLYRCQTGTHVVLAAAHAATAGFWWLINPVGSGVAVAVKRVSFMSQMGSALATPSSPRLNLERVTFTGTPSGAVVTPAKRVRTAVAGLAADATNVASLRTASTGLTLTAGEAIRAFLPMALAAATNGGGAPGEDDWEPESEDEETILAAGEGVVFRQADAGTTSDTRRVITNVTWEEFTAP